MNAQEVTSDLTTHINNYPSTNNAQWYVGIASDARQRLFNDHNVSEGDDVWVYALADTEDVARAVEQYFLNAGFDGGPGGGDASTKTVYAYIKTTSTDP